MRPAFCQFNATFGLLLRFALAWADRSSRHQDLETALRYWPLLISAVNPDLGRERAVMFAQSVFVIV